MYDNVQTTISLPLPESGPLKACDHEATVTNGAGLHDLISCIDTTSSRLRFAVSNGINLLLVQAMPSAVRAPGFRPDCSEAVLSMHRTAIPDGTTLEHPNPCYIAQKGCTIAASRGELVPSVPSPTGSAPSQKMTISELELHGSLER
jgi:hypothetical protein